MAVTADHDLVLTESDGPVSFEPLGGRSGPGLIPSVVFELARLWKLGYEEAREKLLQNLDNYTGRSGKG